MGLAIALIALLAWKREKAAAWFVSAPARLEMVNACDRAWKITVTQSGNPAGEWEVAPRATHVVELPDGEYQIEQTLLAEKGPAQTRVFSMRLRGGQEYRWNLLTLSSRGASTSNAP